jgi:hypothetical protein
MPEAASGFSAVAGPYDAVRPRPPGELISVITQWAGLGRPDVVDLGAGTGRSALAWAGRARSRGPGGGRTGWALSHFRW